LALFRATTAVLGIVPLSGVYTFGLSAPLIGLTLIFSKGDDQQIFGKGLAVITIVVVSLMHVLTFYHWMEFFTRRGVNTQFYNQFSLVGTWWWETWISPNLVFVFGALLFPVFLTCSWKSILSDQVE
jgi:hypothetical protein